MAKRLLCSREEVKGLAASSFARYFTAHMLALCGAEDLSPEADAVLKVLRRCGLEKFTQTYVHRKVRGNRRLERADDVALALAELKEAGFIKLEGLAPGGTGNRPRSPQYSLV